MYSECHINMEDREIVNNVIKNLNESSNKELIHSLDYLSSDFEQTKNAILKLTTHLDQHLPYIKYHLYY